MPSGPLMLSRPKTLTWPLLLLLVSTPLFILFFSSYYRYCGHSNLSIGQARIDSYQTIFLCYTRFPGIQFWYGANHDVWYARNYFQYNEFLSFPDIHARSDKNPWCVNNKPANERHELPKLLHLDLSGHLDKWWLHDGLPRARSGLQQYSDHVLFMGKKVHQPSRHPQFVATYESLHFIFQAFYGAEPL